MSPQQFSDADRGGFLQLIAKHQAAAGDANGALAWALGIQGPLARVYALAGVAEGTLIRLRAGNGYTTYLLQDFFH